MILHEVSVRESRDIMGNIFQPYHTVEEIHVPSFLLVCKDASHSPTATLFKKKGFPVLSAKHAALPRAKDTEKFVREFMDIHLRRQRLN